MDQPVPSVARPCRTTRRVVDCDTPNPLPRCSRADSGLRRGHGDATLGHTSDGVSHLQAAGRIWGTRVATCRPPWCGPLGGPVLAGPGCLGGGA